MECIKCKKEIPDGAPYCCWCGKNRKRGETGHAGTGREALTSEGRRGRRVGQKELTWTKTTSFGKGCEQKAGLHQSAPPSNMLQTLRRKSSEAPLSENTTKHICVGIIYPYRLIVRARRKRHSSA